MNQHQLRHFEQGHQHWSLRKLTIGVASVLLGVTFLGVQQASADTVNNGQVNANTPVAVAVQPSPAATNSQQQAAVRQNVVIPSGYAQAMNGFRPSANGGNSTQNIVNVSQTGIRDNGGNAQGFTSISEQTTNGRTTISMAGNYQHNAQDENEVVDPQNMTANQTQELTTFAAQTINQIRSRVQAQPNGSRVSAGLLRVSPAASQIGSSIVHSAYDHFNGTGHNMTGLEQAARSQGINAWVGENIGGAGSGLLAIQARNAHWISQISMDQLKQSVYNAILAMMFQDNGNNRTGAGAHTTALLNDPSYNPATGNNVSGNAIALNANGTPIANQYLALTIDHRGQAHFNFISDQGASQTVKNRLAQNAVVASFDGNQPVNASQSANNNGHQSTNGNQNNHRPTTNQGRTGIFNNQYLINSRVQRDAFYTDAQGHVYYFDRNGQMLKGHFFSRWGHIYYFGPNGQRYTNQWLTAWGHRYYYGADGSLVTNQMRWINGKLYSFDRNGIMRTNYFYRNWGHIYYFGNDGARFTNQEYQNWGHTYYFGADGALLQNRFATRNGKVYYYDPQGIMYQNRFYTNWGHIYYFGSDGARYTNQWLTAWGHRYYYGADGALLTNTTRRIDGVNYRFDAHGIATPVNNTTTHSQTHSTTQRTITHRSTTRPTAHRA